MRKFNLIALTLIVLFVSAIFAGTTNNSNVTPKSEWGMATYSWSIAVTDTATGGIYYTQAMQIGLGDKAKYGWLYSVCSEGGTEDVNVFIEYSSNGTIWSAGTTDTDFDALGTTAVDDTVGIANGIACQKYQSYGWIRIKYVMGSTNDPHTITGKARFPVLATFAKSTVSKVKNYVP